MDCLNGQKSKMVSEAEENLRIDPKQTVILTEDDIPGAKLERKLLEKYSVTQLKRWLLCRGAKTSGKKEALMAR